MKIVETPIGKIKPYIKNPRNNQNAVDEVAKSIQDYGWQQPIVVDKKNIIIIGHTRLLAAQQLGMKKVPIHFATNLTPKQVKALRIADNKVGEKATWDFDLLKDELNGLDKLFTGFEGDELNNILGNIESVDFPDMPSGDRDSMSILNFTLHPSQVKVIKKALLKVDKSKLDTSLNENSNGNALFHICSKFK